MSNQQNRDPREKDARAADSREEINWTPPALLPEPVQDPDYVYRWVRVSAMGVDDPMNINGKRREGFEPVMPEEQPHITSIRDPRSPFKNAIEIGGLLLCKAPRRMMEQREKYFADLTRKQQAAVDHNLMRENDARMPLFKESKSNTTFGKG